MARLFTSGGSGLGKTTFARKMCEEYDLEYMGSIARNAWSNNPEIAKRPFIERQQFLMTEALKVHRNGIDNIINDRSYLDYRIWTEIGSTWTEDLPDNVFTSDDILIVIPTPCINWYHRNIDYFFGDKIRYDAYTYMFGSQLKPDDFCSAMYHLTRQLEDKIVNLGVQYSNRTGMRMFVPALEDYDSGFHNWQITAHKYIQSTLVRR